MNKDIENLFKDKVLGHPAGLFVIFFTEMWERFSFYGMRVLLINFLTMSLIGYNPGWEWSVENAAALFGTYAMSLYITPIIGGVIADKYTGYRNAVIIGALIMTLGHAAMAFETEMSLYVGLALLVIGTGFFKPTMTAMISEMYKESPEKKDGAYTIYYMGVNAGAFFGMMLCGYLAEKIGWAYGFGLAGIFMLLGTIQFWLSSPLWGDIGGKPDADSNASKSLEINKEEEPRNPFTTLDTVLIAVAGILGIGYAINDPLYKIGGVDLFSLIGGQNVAGLVGLVAMLVVVIMRVARYTKVTRDRMIAFIIFAFFTVFFWMAFEQGASSLVVFARDNVDRVLTGAGAQAYIIINTLLTIVPLGIITYVLVILWKKTSKKIPASNITLFVCFALMWGVVGWMLNRDFSTKAYDVTYNTEQGQQVTSIAEPIDLKVGDAVQIIAKDNKGESFALIQGERIEHAVAHAKAIGRDSGIIDATVKEIKSNQIEITVSWFSILNSFFIIAFASVFSKLWESKYNPSATGKYALGLIIMGIGFGLLAFGAKGIEGGAKVSMIWLILAYLFHTLGELCISPVGLSYVSKLVPGRMIAFMFGMWYIAIAIGNKFAAKIGGQIEVITERYDLSTFFLIFTVVPVVAGILIFLLGPLMKKLMHGVK